MARVKGAMMTRKRRNKTLKLAKGYWGNKSRHFKMANEQVIAEYRRTQLLGGRSAPGDVFVEDWLRCSNGCTATGKGGGSRTLNITPRATSPSTRRESPISRTFCASASRSSSPRRASRRSRSTGCATALRASPTARMCRCSASRRRWGTAQHP